MADHRLKEGTDPHPEVRLELSSPEGRQVWALYSERPDAIPAPETPLARFLQDLPSIAWRWWRRIALGMAAGLALGVLYLLTAAPMYVVRALVHVEQRDSVLQQYDPVRAGSTFIATQSEVIHSPKIVGNAIDTLGLPERSGPGVLATAKDWILSLLPSTNGSEPPDLRTAAVLRALAALNATPVLGTDVMAVTFRTEDPQRGVAFVDALIAFYREYMRTLEAEAHGEGLELLRAQDEELRLELESLHAHYGQLHAKTMALGEDESALSVEKMRLEEHARAVVEAQGRRIDLENRLALDAQNGGGLAPQKNPLVEEMRALEASMAELRASRTDRHPDVRNMQHRIELLRKQLKRNSVVESTQLEREVQAARRTEQMLSRLYVNEWSTAKELEAQRHREEQIRQEIDRVTLERDAVLELLRDKELRVLSLESGHSGTVVRILDPPAVPNEKVWPRPGIVVCGFGFVGALGGLGLAIIGERRLRAANELADAWSS